MGGGGRVEGVGEMEIFPIFFEDGDFPDLSFLNENIKWKIIFFSLIKMKEKKIL